MSAYLDNHSAAKPCSSALERMQTYLQEEYGASFAPHQMGSEQIMALDGRIDALYDLVSAKEEDSCVFASSGSDAIQKLLDSCYFQLVRKEGQCHFAVGALEDAPLMQGLRRLEAERCFAHVVSYTREGVIDLEQLKQSLNPKTALMSLSWANALTGVIQPVEEVVQICKERDVLLHLDASYAVGKVSLELLSDYLTLDGCCMHGLKSSGALFAKKSAPLSLWSSGSNLDIPSITALSAAAQQAMLSLDVMGLETARLRNSLEEGVSQQIPGVYPLFTHSARLSNVSLLCFEGVHQEALLYFLHRNKIYASIGGVYHPHLRRQLSSCGFDEKICNSAISFALSRYTTQKEIDYTVEILRQGVQWARNIGGQR